MDHQFFNNEITKISLVADAASFSDHCVIHRPTLHMYLNCSIFGKFLTHIYFSISKRYCQNRARQKAGVYSLYTRHRSYSLCPLCLT